MNYIKVVSLFCVLLFTQTAHAVKKTKKLQKESGSGDRYITDRQAMSENVEMSHQKLIDPSFPKIEENLDRRRQLNQYQKALFGTTSDQIAGEPILLYSKRKRQRDENQFTRVSAPLSSYDFSSKFVTKSLFGLKNDFYLNNFSSNGNHFAFGLGNTMVFASLSSPTQFSTPSSFKLWNGYEATFIKVISPDLMIGGACLFQGNGNNVSNCRIFTVGKHTESHFKMLSYNDVGSFYPLSAAEIPGSNGQRYLIASKNNIQLGEYDISGFKFKTTHELAEFPISLAFSPDGQYLAVGTNEGAFVYEWPRFSLVRKLETIENAGVKGLAWNPAYSSLLAYGGGTTDRRVRIFDASKNHILFENDARAQVSSMVWAPDGETLVAALGFSSPYIQVYRLNLRQDEWSFDLLHQFSPPVYYKHIRFFNVEVKYEPSLNTNFIYATRNTEQLFIFSYGPAEKKSRLKKSSPLDLPVLR